MKKSLRWAFCLLMCAACAPCIAQDVSRPWEEYGKLIKSRETVSALGPDLFGDDVSLSNGALSFSATDVSVPGNSKLAVAFSRTYNVSSRKGYVSDAPLADWDLDLPRLSGVFASYWEDGRCAVTSVGVARPPTVSSSGTFFYAEDYWQGHQASMPGGGEMLLVNASTPKPTSGGPYYWMTNGFTYFSCLTSIKNGPGEGFLAITADGTKYWFDWMAQTVEPSLKGAEDGSGQIPRRKNVLYATRVEDRFGNWVTYTFTNAYNGPGRLSAINANDGRQITVGYNPQGHVSTVSNGIQSWTYQYSYPTSTEGTLTAVILPDTSRWTINFGALSAAKMRYETGQPGDPVRSCGNPGFIITPGASGSITHPSGAVGEFTVEPWRHGRSNVPMVCANYSTPANDPNDDVAYYPIAYDAFSLTKKKVTGPGLPAAEWSYGYGADITFAPGTGPVCYSGSCIEPVCTSDSCAGVATTIVAGPDSQWLRYTFGNSYRYNEGKLLSVERGSGPSAILKTETTAYELAQLGQPFQTPIGTSPQPRGDGFTSEYLRPQRGNTITQDGATFNSKVNSFDAFARPLSVIKWSSLGYNKADDTEYYDDASKWVMGQVKRVIDADDGKVIAQTDFDPATALPVRQYRFGKLLQTLGYHADGTVATAKDGNNNTTTLTNWKRGIPRNILHADSTTESAVVNDLGWVTSGTDQNESTTVYGYDEMGRLASVVYPGGDSTVWNNKALAFQKVEADEYGLPAGHWRQTMSQGNYRKTLYFDALWRPVVEQEEDVANSSATLRWLTRRYDASGRLAFESYPRNPNVDGWVSVGAAVNGTRTSYDALDRVLQVEQDSELGVLATTTEYLTGFRRRVTNPRGMVTTGQFQAYDQPTMDAPVKIDAPEGVSTAIARDRYLKPQEVARSGPDG